MQITVVLVIKDRPRKETENCLQSLISQNCRIILVDYGSLEANLIWEREICVRPIINLIEVKNDTKIFNKSRALNIGIKEAKTEYIMCGDVDNIYAPNFINEVEKVMNENRLIMCRRYNTKQSGEWEQKIVGAYGGCIVVHKDFLSFIRGFDERYTGWGAEDDDLVERAKDYGLEVYTIPAKTTFCIHQYHRESDKRMEKWNRNYFKAKKPTIRNLKEWGEL